MALRTKPDVPESYMRHKTLKHLRGEVFYKPRNILAEEGLDAHAQHGRRMAEDKPLLRPGRLEAEYRHELGMLFNG